MNIVRRYRRKMETRVNLKRIGGSLKQRPNLNSKQTSLRHLFGRRFRTFIRVTMARRSSRLVRRFCAFTRQRWKEVPRLEKKKTGMRRRQHLERYTPQKLRWSCANSFPSPHPSLCTSLLHSTILFALTCMCIRMRQRERERGWNEIHRDEDKLHFSTPVLFARPNSSFFTQFYSMQNALLNKSRLLRARLFIISITQWAAATGFNVVCNCYDATLLRRFCKAIRAILICLLWMRAIFKASGY